MNNSINAMYELRVLNGLHQGAALPLVGNQWAIGANDELDLALHDAGVEPMHCLLKREGDVWRLDACDGNLLNSEGHTLSELPPNAQFVLGSVWLCLAQADEPWPNLPTVAAVNENARYEDERAPSAAKGIQGHLFGRSACITLGILLGVVGSAWSLSSSKPTAVQEESVKTAPPSAQHSSTSLDVQAAASLLKTMLSERMLTSVSLEHTAEGLALTGTLKDESVPVYERMLQRFKRDHRLDFALEDRVGNATAGLPFAITQIIGGPNGHLVMADGRRMYIGDRVDGMRLVQIEDGRIHFDGERRMDVVW